MNLHIFTSTIIIILGLICFFRPWLLLYLFAAIPLFPYVPMETATILKSAIIQVGNINIYTIDYLLIIMFVLMFFLFCYNINRNIGKLKMLMSSSVSQLLIILFLWDIFIAVLSYNKGFSLQNILRRLSYQSILFLALFIPLLRDMDKKKERFFKFSIFTGILLSIFALIKYGVTHEVEYTSSGTLRTLLGNSVVIFLLPMSYILCYSEYFRKHKLKALIIITLFAVGIHFTGHRSGYLSFLIVLIMWFSIGNIAKFEYLWIPSFSLVLIVALLLIIMLTTKPDSNPDRSAFNDFIIRYRDTFNMENRSTQERLSKWKYSIDVIKDSPIIGLGRFSHYTAHMKEEENSNLDVFNELNRAPHNVLANRFIHQGISGCMLLLIFFYVLLKPVKFSSSDKPNDIKFLKIYILTFILFSMFNTTFEDPNGRIYFFIPAGFLNIAYIKNNFLKE